MHITPVCPQIIDIWTVFIWDLIGLVGEKKKCIHLNSAAAVDEV